MSARAFLERHRSILDFTLASLARRKGKNLALLLVYAFVVATLASVLLATQALRREALALLRDAPELSVQRTVAGRHELLPQRWVEAIAAIRGVSEVRGRLWGYVYDPLSRANYTVVAAAPPGARAGAVAIGRGVARATGTSPGDRLALPGPDADYLTFSVAEVFPEESDLVTSDLVVVAEEDFRRLFAMPEGLYTDAAVTIRSAREVPTVAGKVARLLPQSRPIQRSEIARTYESIFGWRSGLVVLALLGALLAFVVVAWDKATGLSAEERREIGILKAIGWETSDVLVMKLWEGAAVSLSAFALGVVLAYLHVSLGRMALLAPVLRGWSTLYPDLRVAPRLDPYEIAALFFLAVVPYTAATVVPTWRAATIDPDSAMRS